MDMESEMKSLEGEVKDRVRKCIKPNLQRTKSGDVCVWREVRLGRVSVGGIPKFKVAKNGPKYISVLEIFKSDERAIANMLAPSFFCQNC